MYFPLQIWKEIHGNGERNWNYNKIEQLIDTNQTIQRYKKIILKF
jgi:hypothetical protein